MHRAAEAGTSQTLPSTHRDEPERDWTELMRAGLFDEAWQVSDRVLACRARADPSGGANVPRHLQNTWTGAPLSGKRVLVRCYHGLGDTIQFSRYLPDVQRIAAETIVWIQPSLIHLVGSVVRDVRLLPLHDGAPEVSFDVDVEIMELPYVFRTTTSTIPMPLFARAPRRRITADRPVVGLKWSAGDWDSGRSMPFALVESLLGGSDARFVSLEEELAPAARRWFTRAGPRGIAAMVGAIEACDIVITVDTMVAHLAGSLGVPTWTLLKHHADWRWLLHRSDSPWYPSMRLYRQPCPGEWQPVLAAVRDDLATI